MSTVVHGTVLKSSGGPAVGAEVHLRALNQATSVRTDELGAYRFTVEDSGLMWIRPRSTSDMPTYLAKVITTAADASIQIDFTPATSGYDLEVAVEGVLEGPASIEIVPEDAPPARVVRDIFAARPTAHAIRVGQRFWFRGISPGRYVIERATFKGRACCWIELPVTVGPGGCKAILLPAEGGRVIPEEANP